MDVRAPVRAQSPSIAKLEELFTSSSVKAGSSSVTLGVAQLFVVAPQAGEIPSSIRIVILDVRLRKFVLLRACFNDYSLLQRAVYVEQYFSSIIGTKMLPTKALTLDAGEEYFVQLTLLDSLRNVIDCVSSNVTLSWPENHEVSCVCVSAYKHTTLKSTFVTKKHHLFWQVRREITIAQELSDGRSLLTLRISDAHQLDVLARAFATMQDWMNANE